MLIFKNIYGKYLSLFNKCFTQKQLKRRFMTAKISFVFIALGK